jgi:hypothetical protein
MLKLPGGVRGAMKAHMKELTTLINIMTEIAAPTKVMRWFSGISSILELP